MRIMSIFLNDYPYSYTNAANRYKYKQYRRQEPARNVCDHAFPTG